MRYIITSGGMEIHIDNVRTILNTSTGQLGSLFASKLSQRKDNEVIYIHTQSAKKPSTQDNIKCVEIHTVDDVVNMLTKYVIKDSVVIHLMAISDFEYGGYINSSEVDLGYKDKLKQEDKIDSKEDILIYLKRSPKVIDQIKKINEDIYLVGFKLLSNVSKGELLEVQRKLLKKANCDLVVGNIKEGIKEDRHKAFILNNEDKYEEANTKEEIVNKVINIIRRDYEKNITRS